MHNTYCGIYDLLYEFQISYGESRKVFCFYFIFSHRESFFVCKPFVVNFSSHSSVFDSIDQIDPIDRIDSKWFDEVAAAELSNIDVGAKSEQGTQSKPEIIVLIQTVLSSNPGRFKNDSFK